MHCMKEFDGNSHTVVEYNENEWTNMPFVLF